MTGFKKILATTVAAVALAAFALPAGPARASIASLDRACRDETSIETH